MSLLCMHSSMMALEMLISNCHVTFVNIIYLTNFSTVIISHYFIILSADHCQPSFPSVRVLGETIHPMASLWPIGASKCCTANHGMITDLYTMLNVKKKTTKKQSDLKHHIKSLRAGDNFSLTTNIPQTYIISQSSWPNWDPLSPYLWIWSVCQKAGFVKRWGLSFITLAVQNILVELLPHSLLL